MLVTLREAVVAEDEQPSRPPAAATYRIECTREADDLKCCVSDPPPNQLPAPFVVGMIAHSAIDGHGHRSEGGS
jgi:hypothetical protein